MVDVSALLRGLAKSKAKRWFGDNIALSFDLNPVPLISAPPEDIIEIVENLLSNALRSVRQAGRMHGEVVVTTRSVSVPRGGLEIEVYDNGKGVPRDIERRIFEAGFTTFKEHGGTGLGLYLVQTLAEIHKGTIKCESQFGNWARFKVFLPADTV
jgi:signal transduction histidine kinase